MGLSRERARAWRRIPAGAAGETISVGEIVRRTEEGFAERPEEPAATVGDRRLAATFDLAQAAFLAVLDRRTIRDIVANEDELRRALGLDVPA